MAFAQSVSIVSVNSAGELGDRSAHDPSVSDDGRFVAFLSRSSNMGPGRVDTQWADVYVRDRVLNTTTRVSVNQNGLSGNEHSWEPHISATGRYVVFASKSVLTNETLACLPLEPCIQVYLHDRETRETSLVSRSSSGAPSDRVAGRPRVSADGRWILFDSNATNFADGMPRAGSAVFLRDRQTGTTTRISPAGLQSVAGDLSDDASIATFSVSFEDPEASTRQLKRVCTQYPCYATYIYERQTGALRLLDPPTPPSDLPVETVARGVSSTVSADGRYVAAVHHMFVLNDRPWAASQVFIYDRVRNRTTIVGVFDLAEQAAISPDGRYVTFHAKDRGRMIYDQKTSLLTSLGALFAGFFADISAHGRHVVLTASDGIPADTNQQADVYLIDRDADGDGMTGDWETTFGLNPQDAADAGGDPDDDGRTNLQEFENGSHPRGAHTRYFAEGAAK